MYSSPIIHHFSFIINKTKRPFRLQDKRVRPHCLSTDKKDSIFIIKASRVSAYSGMLSACLRNAVRMLPECCPYAIGLLSACRRNHCPHVSGIRNFDFQYIAVGINKFSEKLPQNLKNGNMELYKYISGVALTSSLPYLDSATLIIDKSGSKAFQTSLRQYIREELDDREGKRIKKFKSQESNKNNLLQLADYCVGILARKMTEKKGWEDYYMYISKKEISVIELLK